MTALATTLAYLGSLQAYRLGGAYILRDSDHSDLMIASSSGGGGKSLRVLIVGNSLTYVKDEPGMLANIAAADPGLNLRLEIQAKTHVNATLEEMISNPGALAWARANRPDVVVLQDHSGWYNDDDGESGYAQRGAARWRAALAPQGARLELEEVWGDADGSRYYADLTSSGHALTADEDSRRAAVATTRLANRLGFQVVTVGDAFAAARRTPGAPNVYGPDKHHASVAGAYLAALVLYRDLTGRSGSASTYRPFGLSAEDAAALLRIANRA